MTLIIASNFGDIATAGMISSGLLIAALVSLASFLLVLPAKLRRKGRWHGWFALICSAAYFIAAIFLMTSLQRSLDWSDSWLFLLFCVPALLAAGSLYMSRKKELQPDGQRPTRGM